MAKRKRKLPRVELLNVPAFRQGSFDSLCAYYTAAMMLSTLHPEYVSRFGQAARQRATKRLSDDPIIKRYDVKDQRKGLAKWFYQGEFVGDVTKVLNKIMLDDGKSTRFKCGDEPAADYTYRRLIAESINEGLPVMLGWNTPDYGNHAVLITGYWEGRERWLLINDPDPTSGPSEISWDSLKIQKTAKFEVGLCEPHTHVGYRPLKTVTRRGSVTVSRWTSEGYKQIEDC